MELDSWRSTKAAPTLLPLPRGPRLRAICCTVLTLLPVTGDDPKDVKARLKVWAQAVALASASRLGS
jgi:hypothetical protein